MKPATRHLQRRHRRPARSLGARIRCCLLGAILAGTPVIRAQESTNPPPEPATPRESYNAGTRKLAEGKLREAETLFQNALMSQADSLQPAALYNIGWLRFAQGAEELKRLTNSASAPQHSQQAEQGGEQAALALDEALNGQDVEKLLAAYTRGRGARRDLKAATAAVQSALETYGATLAKWQRASGDFKGAAELNSADTNAQYNAEVVDRAIAKLIDQVRELQQKSMAMSGQCSKLEDKLEKLKGRLPKGQTPSDGEPEDQDDFPHGPQPGQQEGPSREGAEMPMSPEQAAWLLDGFKLGGDRHLPMTRGDAGRPKDRARPTW